MTTVRDRDWSGQSSKLVVVRLQLRFMYYWVHKKGVLEHTACCSLGGNLFGKVILLQWYCSTVYNVLGRI